MKQTASYPHPSLLSLHHLLPNPKYCVCDSLYCLLDVFRNLVLDIVRVHVKWNSSVSRILENHRSKR